MEQETFSAVEEAEAKKIVLEEGEEGEEEDVVEECEARVAGVALFDDGLRAESAVAVEVSM